MSSAFGILNEDISEYNVFELADWIYLCRTMFDDITADHIKTDPQHIAKIVCFCEDWFEHSENYRNTYYGYKYRRALNLLGMPRPRYIVQYGDGSRNDITEMILPSQDMHYRQISASHEADKKAKNIEITALQQDIQAFVNGDSSRLAMIINSFSMNSVTRHFTTSKNEFSVGAFYGDTDQFLSSCERLPDDTANTNMSYTNYCATCLREHHINKNTYYAYLNTGSKKKVSQKTFDASQRKAFTAEKSINYRTAPRVIGKSFFTNVAFLLALDATQAEKMYKSNGYSIADSVRLDDMILYKSFICGFPLRYASILLVNSHYPRLEMGSTSAAGNNKSVAIV